MGRRDAVAFVLECVAEARRILPRLQVDFVDGWATRGNGTSANYEGLLVHHTGFVATLTNPNPALARNSAGRSTLVDGRPDLTGPLCNTTGPVCTVEAPRLVVVSANPANHAGASGGRSMGPLPVTSLFNPRVLGHEIDYAGVTPMSDGQDLVAKVWGLAVSRVLGRPSAEWVRAHAETSITGKWDIGYATGRTVDMAVWRRGAWQITTLIPDMEDDMPNYTDWAQQDKNNLVHDIVNFPMITNGNKDVVSIADLLNALERKTDGYGHRTEHIEGVAVAVSGIVQQLSAASGQPVDAVAIASQVSAAVSQQTVAAVQQLLAQAGVEQAADIVDELTKRLAAAQPTT